MAHNPRYPLYYTLNTNLPTTNLSKGQKSQLLEKLANLDEESKKAVLMLIAEHSLVVDDHQYGACDTEIPYGGIQEKGDVKFELDKLPLELRWILFKFNFRS